ncbi:PQQ-dependent sugar dehydrogenase [Sphingomonas bacterium]|uniref:PQQ-dependent sugar dehydrogenase n=1 Tax=Sphingomonas bacterium TaxID=1895847 RepID=UPI001575004E|nr:PQQ-dependent sugar dehydrogenase [Sphingomonas bacterium]
MLLASLSAWRLGATEVINPIPTPIGIDARAMLTSFVTAPATGAGSPATLIHGLRSAPDGSGRLFVNDTRGTISVTTAAGAPPAVWFDIRRQDVGFTAPTTQSGLLSVAFHPNFGIDPTRPGYATFYTIDTTAADAGVARYAGKGPADHQDVLREWTVADPDAAAATITGMREVLRVTQPYADHGPGTIAFNPAATPGSSDYGKLYIGLGDGGGVNDPNDNAQDLTSPFGKILRIDPADPDGPGGRDYTIPVDNPLAGQAGTLGEIYAYGLRNPQLFGWDPVTGRMYIADIGQARLEEIDLGVAGGNYGWPAREGTFGRSADKGVLAVNDDPNPGFLDPIAQYDHDEGAAISAAVLYRGSDPALFGRMVVSDLVNGRLFDFSLDDTGGVGGTAVLGEIALSFAGLSTSLLALEGQRGRVDLRLGTDAGGELYLLTEQSGDIYRLTAAAVPEPLTWFTTIAGLGLIGALIRRARAHTAAA